MEVERGVELLEARQPTWSPDGRFIAFSRLLNGKSQVVMVSALGGPEQMVAPGYGGDWTPDGTSLIFSRWSEDGRSNLIRHVLKTGLQVAAQHP